MLHIETRGMLEARARWADVQERLRDITPVLEDVRRAWLASNARTFATRAGGTWPPLAQRTLARKRRRGMPPTPLVGHRGRLLEELSVAPPINQLSATRLRLGTRSALAELHHTGRGVPRRRLVDLPPSFKNDAVRALLRHLLGGAR